MTPTQILRADVDTLLKDVAELKEKFGSLTPSKGPERTLTPTIKADISAKVIDLLGESDPVPAQYSEEVAKVFGKEFGVHMKYAGEGFHFSIIVPEKYSTRTPQEKADGIPDVRLKVIEHALGVNGVKEFIDLVYKNFNPEIQALIQADKLHQQGL